MVAGLDWALGAWWGAAVLSNLATVVLGLLPRRPSGPTGDCRPMSIMVPVKGADPAVARNVEALLAQDYPEFEILFAVADPGDPAIALLERAIADHPAPCPARR